MADKPPFEDSSLRLEFDPVRDQNINIDQQLKNLRTLPVTVLRKFSQDLEEWYSITCDNHYISLSLNFALNF